MSIFHIRIAIMSDLHCHHTYTDKSEESYLVTDRLRTPANSHPVESLRRIITQHQLEVDTLLCPGDLTNKIDIQGFLTGWDFINEVAKELKAKKVIATLGNHDVDSRNSRNEDAFRIAKGIGRGFPFNDPTLETDFWSNGFCIVEDDYYRVLVINSVFYHNNEAEAIRGKIDDRQLESLKQKISQIPNNKIQIALCHHHPIQHERLMLGASDLMINGTNLIDLLNEYKFDILIHGHKHDPWIRYSGGVAKASMVVFSAGSFSAKSTVLYTGAKNTFHIVDIYKEKDCKELSYGRITTWEFLPMGGWRLADSGSYYFPAITGFGSKQSIYELVDKTIQYFNTLENKVIRWDKLIENVPNVEFLTPTEDLEFQSILQTKNFIISETKNQQINYRMIAQL